MKIPLEVCTQYLRPHGIALCDFGSGHPVFKFGNPSMQAGKVVTTFAVYFMRARGGDDFRVLGVELVGQTEQAGQWWLDSDTLDQVAKKFDKDSTLVHPGDTLPQPKRYYAFPKFENLARKA